MTAAEHVQPRSLEDYRSGRVRGNVDLSGVTDTFWA